jgi:hypothetical protein
VREKTISGAAPSRAESMEAVRRADAPGEAPWRPIETAPTDGSFVLVWFRGEAHVARYSPIWHPDNLRWNVRHPQTGAANDMRVVTDIGVPMWGEEPLPVEVAPHQGPTHWAPLPLSPPVAGSEVLEKGK